MGANLEQGCASLRIGFDEITWEPFCTGLLLENLTANDFSWHLIFADTNNLHQFVVSDALEII